MTGQSYTCLAEWIEKTRQARSTTAIFELLDRFRRLDWTDREAAAMSHAYMSRLARLNRAAADDSKNQAPAAEVASEARKEAEDSPVWYEEM